MPQADVTTLKLSLLSVVSGALLAEPNYYSPEPSDVKSHIIHTCAQLCHSQPEFILKVALYVREELNVRSTANFLLALAGTLPACSCFVRWYFRHVIRLPSDWLDMPRILESLAGKERGRNMPNVIRVAMKEKV